MNIQRISYEGLMDFLSSLNVILLFVGFPIFTLFAYGTAEVQTSNLPSIIFRGFHVVIALLVITLSKDLSYLKSASVLFCLFFMILVRIIYDGFVRIDCCDMPIDITQKLLLESIGFTFIPVIAIAYGFVYIDLSKIFKWVYWGLLLMMSIFIFRYLSGQVMVGSGRVALSVAQSTLALAKFGGWLLLFSYASYKNSITLKNRVCYFLTAFLGIFCSLIAGSRGAVVGTIIAFLFLFLTSKNYVKLFLPICLVIVVCAFFSEQIFSFLYQVFPIIFKRFAATIEKGDTSGRDVIFKIAYQRFCENPILGDWLLVGSFKDSTNAAHNLTLEVASSLGLVGLSCLLYMYFLLLRAIDYLKAIPEAQIMSALCICMLVMSLSGGSLRNPDFSSIYMLTLLSFKKYKYLNKLSFVS